MAVHEPSQSFETQSFIATMLPAVPAEVNGKTLMKGLLTRQPRKRLGSGLGGWEDVRGAEYFQQGHSGGSLFDKLLGHSELWGQNVSKCFFPGDWEVYWKAVIHPV